MTQASNLVNKKKKKKDQINPKFSRAENNKGNLKINETEKTKKKNRDHQWTQNWINEIDKPLARLIKKKERTQLAKISNKKRISLKILQALKILISEYCKHLSVNK